MKNAGRNKGSLNKFSRETREILFNLLDKDHLQRIDKLLNYVDYDLRLSALKPFIKILTSKDDYIGSETRILVFEGLKQSLNRNRLSSLIDKTPNDRKLTEVRQWIQMLSPEQIELLFKNKDRV